jgi:hypothetical protein
LSKFTVTQDSFKIGIRLSTTLSTGNENFPFTTIKESQIRYDSISVDIPTMAYRPNQVGINHVAPEAHPEALLVLGKTNTINSKNKIVPRNQIIFEGNDGSSTIFCHLVNFHIDCGEWTST